MYAFKVGFFFEYINPLVLSNIKVALLFLWESYYFYNKKIIVFSRNYKIFIVEWRHWIFSSFLFLTSGSEVNKEKCSKGCAPSQLVIYITYKGWTVLFALWIYLYDQTGTYPLFEIQTMCRFTVSKRFSLLHNFNLVV